MKEIQFAILGSNKYDDLLKMKVLEVFKFDEYQSIAIQSFNKWHKRYRYCCIVKTIYG